MDESLLSILFLLYTNDKKLHKSFEKKNCKNYFVNKQLRNECHLITILQGAANVNVLLANMVSLPSIYNFFNYLKKKNKFNYFLDHNLYVKKKNIYVAIKTCMWLKGNN